MYSKGIRAYVTAMLHGGLSNHDAPRPRSELVAQVDRVAGSSVFHGSEALSKLLRYLANRSLTAPAEHLKEYQIATEVLGRSPDFDPQTDSCVRVQVGRLRNKLAEYYDSAGAEDTIVIRLPKGGYLLSFEEKSVARKSDLSSDSAHSKPARSAILHPRILLALCLVAVSASLLTGTVLIFFGPDRASVRAGSKSAAASQVMGTFWAPFLHDQDGPYVVFSNAGFVGRPVTGMRYFDPAKDQPNQVTYHYTGVGELAGAVRLGVLFQQFGRPFRLKRGGLFTLDEALHNDLVFLGSPTENPQLNKILTTREYIFGNVATDPQNRFGVVVIHPRAGEAAGFPSTAAPSGEDYAIIALAPGLDSSHRILILEGTSTLTTEAAVDFVCDQSSVAQLVQSLNPINKSPLPTFEAVIQVKIADDVPLESRLVAFRKTTY